MTDFSNDNLAGFILDNGLGIGTCGLPPSERRSNSGGNTSVPPDPGLSYLCPTGLADQLGPVSYSIANLAYQAYDGPVAGSLQPSGSSSWLGRPLPDLRVQLECQQGGWRLKTDWQGTGNTYVELRVPCDRLPYGSYSDSGHTQQDNMAMQGGTVWQGASDVNPYIGPNYGSWG